MCHPRWQDPVGLDSGGNDFLAPLPDAPHFLIGAMQIPIELLDNGENLAM